MHDVWDAYLRTVGLVGWYVGRIRCMACLEGRINNGAEEGREDELELIIS